MISERKPRFLLAENLNRLAKYLRMLGYDAEIYKSISFSNKIRLANKDKRIFLTRSQKEAKSTIQFSRKRIFSNFVREQIKELRDYISLSENHLFSRCLVYNKKLHQIKKEKIQSLVPGYVYYEHNDFYLCRKCGRIYWRGTHSKRMKKMLENLLSNHDVDSLE